MVNVITNPVLNVLRSIITYIIQQAKHITVIACWNSHNIGGTQPSTGGHWVVGQVNICLPQCICEMHPSTMHYDMLSLSLPSHTHLTVIKLHDPSP